jgi:hypothetical protein
MGLPPLATSRQLFGFHFCCLFETQFTWNEGRKFEFPTPITNPKGKILSNYETRIHNNNPKITSFSTEQKCNDQYDEKKKTSEDSTETEEEGNPPTLKVKVEPKKKKRREAKTVKTPGANSDSESEGEDQTPAQKETPSRLQQQKLKARRCPNMVKIKTKFGTKTVRKPGMPFKRKNKPGLGERKKFKKNDLMTVTRNQDRKSLGKLIRPFASGEFLQPRMAFADRNLQRITRPPLRETRWILGDIAAGTPGHMDVDPRRQDSYRLLRKMFKIMKKQDEYLNPEMRAFGKKPNRPDGRQLPGSQRKGYPTIQRRKLGR